MSPVDKQPNIKPGNSKGHTFEKEIWFDLN